MKNLKTVLSCIAAILLLSSDISAQDYVFANYQNAPSYLNPAQTGAFDGEQRALINYRNQWSNFMKGGTYKTFQLSYDRKVELSSAGTVGVGFRGQKDNSGSLDFTRKQGSFLFSFLKTVGSVQGNHSVFGLGLDFGLVKQTINLDLAEWPSQHIGNGGFNGNLPGGDVSSESFYTDLSSGAFWKYQTASNFSFQIGAAFHHMNGPNVSLTPGGYSALSKRKSLYSKVDIPVVKQLIISPAYLLVKQGPHQIQNIGSALKLQFDNTESLSFLELGIYRSLSTSSLDDSNFKDFIFSLSTSVDDFYISASFDRETTPVFEKLNTTSYELSIGYIFGGKKKVTVQPEVQTTIE